MMPHMSCLDHTPDKQYLGHIFEHCQRVRWALHPILLNLHTLWNRPAHPSHLALKTERNLHPLCGKGVQSYQNHQHFSCRVFITQLKGWRSGAVPVRWRGSRLSWAEPVSCRGRCPSLGRSVRWRGSRPSGAVLLCRCGGWPSGAIPWGGSGAGACSVGAVFSRRFSAARFSRWRWNSFRPWRTAVFVPDTATFAVSWTRSSAANSTLSSAYSLGVACRSSINAAAFRLERIKAFFMRS